MVSEFSVVQIWINFPSLHSCPTQTHEVELCEFCFVCLFPPLIYDSMRRTLLMVDIGQDNTCGKHRPVQIDKVVLLWAGSEGGDWLGGPRHLLNRRCQGDVKAKDDSRKPEKEVCWSLLPITPHILAVWSGQDHWADNSPCRFLLPVREPAFPGSCLLSPREAAGITFTCPSQCHL